MSTKYKNELICIRITSDQALKLENGFAL